MVAFRPIQQASHDLAVLADLFKQAGRGDLRRMLLARIRTAGKPTIAAVQARARATLPLVMSSPECWCVDGVKVDGTPANCAQPIESAAWY